MVETHPEQERRSALRKQPAQEMLCIGMKRRQRVPVDEREFRFRHQHLHAPAALSYVPLFKMLVASVFRSAARLRSGKPDLRVSLNRHHLEGLSPTLPEHPSFRRPAHAIDHKQRCRFACVDGVGQSDGEDLIAVLRPQVNRNVAKHLRPTLEAPGFDLGSNHVAHGTDRHAKAAGDLCKLPLPGRGQAAHGEDEHGPASRQQPMNAPAQFSKGRFDHRTSMSAHSTAEPSRSIPETPRMPR